MTTIQPHHTDREDFIIAIDFDDTLCRGGFPDISKGTLIIETVAKMDAAIRRREAEGKNVTFILWTCREGQHLEDAKQFIQANNLPIYYFNEEAPCSVKWLAENQFSNSRKIYAHEYWDDKAKPITVYDPNYPGTLYEQEVHEDIIKVWNSFIELPQTHPSDIQEFHAALHQLQQIMAMRVVRDNWPKVWPKYTHTSNGWEIESHEVNTNDNC